MIKGFLQQTARKKEGGISKVEVTGEFGKRFENIKSGKMNIEDNEQNRMGRALDGIEEVCYVLYCVQWSLLRFADHRN